MKNKLLYGVIACLAVFAVGFVAFGYSGPAPKVVVEGDYLEAQEVPDQFGAMPGPDLYNDMYFHQKLVNSGRVLASSSAIASATLLPRDVTRYEQIDYNPIVGSAAAGLHILTLPASSTMVSFLSNASECTITKIRNVNTTAASSTPS